MKQPFQLQFQIQSDFGYLPFLTKLFYGLKAKAPFPLTQILVEAFNNAVVHAHRRQKKKWVGIEMALSKRGTRLRIVDQGPGMDQKQKREEAWQTHGRGLTLIRAFASRRKSFKKGKKHIFEATIDFSERPASPARANQYE